MERFLKIFPHRLCNVIGMIHVNALPGTPLYNNWSTTIEKARYEAHIYAKYQIDSVLLENMHDIPYVQERLLGPEITASMARLSGEVRSIIPRKTPCGIQILACGNRQALAVAKACNLQFIRSEAYVFGHVADEGYADACAGQLLRYRQTIDANHVLVFTDLKKKHSSHAITQDVSLLETAKAAEFFLTDGNIITGTSTGHAAKVEDVAELFGKVKTPIIIGSGVTRSNIESYFPYSNAVIIGSHFKVDGSWENEISEASVDEFMRKISELRKWSEQEDTKKKDLF